MNNSTASSVSYISATPGHVVAATFVALLILLTLAGNIMVVACFCCYRNLRTICNYFIISLSVADILVALLAMPFWLILQLTNMQDDSKYIFSQWLYVFWSCADILVGIASIMNLIAVSFDRHLAITAPYSYTEYFTSTRAIAMIVAVWVYAVVLSMFRAVPQVQQLAISVVVFVMGFILPLLIMIVLYTRIYFVAINQARRIGRDFAKDVKAAKTIAIVIGAFLICWMPFFVIVMVFAVDPQHQINLEVYKAIKWLEYLNSCLNPIIYTVLNRTYRRSFHKLITRCCRRDRSMDNFNSFQSTNVPLQKGKCESHLQGSSSSNDVANQKKNNNGVAAAVKCSRI